MIQGAFSVSFINWGKSYGDHGMTADPLTLQRYKVSIGRITALHSVPMQIKWEDIQGSCEPSIEQSRVPQWLKAECQGTRPTKVLAIDEERTVDWYLHFFVPQKIETTFPKQVVFEGKKILIEHALPFAPIRSSITRPPIEETMHEHWKNTASLAPDKKKHRSNCLVHDEDCFPSLQRVNMLQEISVKSRGLKLSGSFEASTTPILFLNGMPDIEDGLSAFVSITSQVTEIAADVEFSVEKHLQQPRSGSEHSNYSGTLYVLSIQCTDHVPLSIGKVFPRRNGCAVSTTELLKCHAFTECLLLLILPKGIKIDGICTPKRHFDIVVRIPIVSQRESEKEGCPSPLTPLGHNATQLSLRGHTTDQDKPSPSCVRQQSYVSFAQAQTDDGGERHSQSHGPRELSEKSKQAPEPVVVDGCRNSSSKKQCSKESTERDEIAAAILTSYAAPLEDQQSENKEVPAQPVVVDGCGEHTAPVFKTESSQWKVSPTAIWTAIPRELADIRNPEQLPEKTKCRKEEGEWLKQNCEEKVREENKHESQEQIKMYQALEPIPESDGHGTNYGEALSKEGGNKPKALPLKVTPTVRQHLAKISAASVTQEPLASRKSESMPALSQEENRKTSCDETPSPMEEEPALTGIPGTQVPTNHTKKIMPGNRPVVQLGENIRTIQRSRSAGHPPLTPNRKANSVSNSRSCPPKSALKIALRPLIINKDGHFVAAVTSMYQSLLEGKTDCPISGVFGAGKTLSAAAMIAGLLVMDPSLTIMIVTKENVAAHAFVKHFLRLGLPESINCLVGRLVGYVEMKKGPANQTALDIPPAFQNDVLRSKRVIVGCGGGFHQECQQPYSPVASWMEEADVALNDEGQQYGNLDEASAIARVPRKCLVVWCGDHKQTPGGLRKTDEAKAFRRKLLRRPIALRGDTKHLQPNMLGKVVLRYLDGMDEPLIHRVQVILRATMGGRSVSSEEDIVTLQLLCQEVGCPYHEELRSTACSVALVVLWMGLHQEKFPLLATTLQAAAGVAGPQKWALILPSSARVSLVTYTAVIAVRYPELDNVQNDLMCFGNYLLGEQATSGGFLPLFWDAPSAYMHAATFFCFFCCIAERAIKPCRSSRSKLRGEFGIPRHSQNWKQKHTKATKPNNNTKQTKDKSRQVLECETRGEKRVKRPKRPNALICRTPGGSMRYP